MNIIGITAEYNPLHNGHVHHIAEARRLSGCDAVVVAMSGDFVQRGEPALLDKWTRTRLALESGADLVVEIPALFCLGNASQYAGASVRLLEALGCDRIAFGSECADADIIVRMAGFIMEHREEIISGISEKIRQGLSYPAAREEVYRSLRLREVKPSGNGMDHSAIEACQNPSNYEADTGDAYIKSSLRADIDDEISVLSNPNDILGLEYVMHMESAQPLAIKREGAGYSDDIVAGVRFQSASGIRKFLELSNRREEKTNPPEWSEQDYGQMQAILDHNVAAPGIGDADVLTYEKDIRNSMPEATAEALKKCRCIFPDDCLQLIRYAALEADAAMIDDCPSGGEGLGNLIKSAARSAGSFDELVHAVKSKRYTYTRISRLCMQLLLGITRSRYPFSEPLYIRVLGFNEIGRKVLAEYKAANNEDFSIAGCKDYHSDAKETEDAGVRQPHPVITNLNKGPNRLSASALKMLELDLHSADVFNLIQGADINNKSDRASGIVLY